MIIVSFLLDAILSNYLSSPLIPLFTLTMFVIIYNHQKYYQIIIITGLLYDIAHTNTLFINMVLFLFIAYTIKMLYKFLNDRLINDIIILIISITIYRTLYYLILIISNLYKFDINILFKSIYSSLIINIIYLILVKTLIKKKK